MAATALEASTTKLPSISQLFSSQHGSQIFVYTHLRTRQTIYSLAKIMTKDALKQLTFVGKKTVPATLRKDMWAPLCVLDFPNPYQGLHAYARLREFRERHETEWPLDEFTVTKGPHVGNLMSRRERSFKLMDQKANSIADMAAVLAMQARPPESWLVEKMARMVDTKEWYIKKKGKDFTKKIVQPSWPRAKRGQNSKIGHKVFEFQGKINGTSIWWANLDDAEYAEAWPTEVVHHDLQVVRGHARWPPLSADEAASARSAIQKAEKEVKSEAELEQERIALLKEKIADARKRAIKVPRPIKRPNLNRRRTGVKDSQDTQENNPKLLE